MKGAQIILGIDPGTTIMGYGVDGNGCVRIKKVSSALCKITANF